MVFVSTANVAVVGAVTSASLAFLKDFSSAGFYRNETFFVRCLKVFVVRE